MAEESSASVREALGGAVDALAAAGVESPRLDAELLLAQATGWSRERLATDPDSSLPSGAARVFGQMVRRRVRREPVAYILGRKAFRDIELEIEPTVLIPRPETELLVEIALELVPATVLDVGTGSGAVALAVADELPGTEVTATDTSADALRLAQSNAAKLGLERVTFTTGTLPARGSFELVLANLPMSGRRNGRISLPKSGSSSPARRWSRAPAGWRRLSPWPPSSRPIRGWPRLWRWRSGRARPRPWPGCWKARASPGSRAARTWPGSNASCSAAGLEGGALSEAVSIERDGANAAREALERVVGAGGVVVFPADGLYGLGCDPLNAEAIERVHRIKGRDEAKPSAVLYFSPLAMRELIAGLGEGARGAMAALLPGPVTLVVANPEHRYPLAARDDPGRLGIRLIEGPLLGAACPVFQTSANRSGEPAPAGFDGIEPAVLEAVDLAIDGGELGGEPSTVIDVSGLDSGGDWEVLREGALSVAEVAARLDLD